jgi:hypothetical protein
VSTQPTCKMVSSKDVVILMDCDIFIYSVKFEQFKKVIMC